MDDQPDDRQALNRWMAIQAARVGGVVLAILGLLIGEGRVPGPPWLGYGMLVAGLAVIFVVPLKLARKWRSPKP